MIRTALLAVVIAHAPAVLAAQQHPLVGVWQITYPGGMRIENGTPTAFTFTGKLTVEARADSLIGTLVTNPPADLPPRPDVRLATKVAPGNVIFVHRSTATVNRNGDQQQVTSLSTWTLVVTGDQLNGTVDRKLEGLEMPSAGPQPVTGTRVKS